MMPSLIHTMLEVLLIGLLFRIFEYHFPETTLGKILIFAY